MYDLKTVGPAPAPDALGRQKAFESCLFNGIGPVGDESFITAFMATMTVEDARA